MFTIGHQRSVGPLYKQIIKQTLTAILDATDNENIATIIQQPSKDVKTLSSRFEKVEDTTSYVNRILSRIPGLSSSQRNGFAESALRLAGEEIIKEKSNQRKTVVLILNQEPQTSLNREIRQLRDKNIFVAVIVLGNDLDALELKRKLPDSTILYVVTEEDDWIKIFEEIKITRLTSMFFKLLIGFLFYPN